MKCPSRTFQEVARQGTSLPIRKGDPASAESPSAPPRFADAYSGSKAELFFWRYPESTCVLLYRGRERRRIDAVWCLPVEWYLREMRPGRGLSPDAS